MKFANQVSIEDVMKINNNIPNILEQDRSSNKNIIWATNIYSSHKFDTEVEYWMGMMCECCLSIAKKIRTKVEQTKKLENINVKHNLDIFTPSRICNAQNNLLDNDWFKYENVFNISNAKKWIVNKNKIQFSNDKTWQDYVNLNVLEVTCGEAPYLASRYDVTTGAWIDVDNRIGLLDRKIRVINENTNSESQWYSWVVNAYKSTYGYEWKGDRLLIARENLLLSFVDYYVDRFQKNPTSEHLHEIANIISWNLWQMDGLNGVIPYSSKLPTSKGELLFEYEEAVEYLKNAIAQNHGINCKIIDWKNDTSMIFRDMGKNQRKYFDYVVGNLPYKKESLSSDKTDDVFLYNDFRDASYLVGKKVILIAPYQCLFDSKKDFQNVNIKTINNEYFQISFYETLVNKNSDDMPNDTNTKYQKNILFDPALQIIDAPQMASILYKVMLKSQAYLPSIIYKQSRFNISTLYKDFSEIKEIAGDKWKEKRMTRKCLKYPCFYTKKQTKNDIEILGAMTMEILGVNSNIIVRRYLNPKYLNPQESNIDTYKVFIQAHNNTNILNEALKRTIIGKPQTGHTNSFMSIGAYATKKEALNTSIYIKSKFCKALLRAFKPLPYGKYKRWEFVPLQDFTNRSDIDWSVSMEEIDRQLYKKYDLSEEEINFIESEFEDKLSWKEKVKNVFDKFI